MRFGNAPLAVAAAAAVLAMIPLVAATSSDPPRCPEGLEPLGARCCGEGQGLRDGACVGVARRCSEGLELVEGTCVASESRVLVPRGDSSWRPPDDQIGSNGEVAHTENFLLDRTEVTWSRWKKCARAKACVELAPIAGGDLGQAAHGATLDEARAFCRWAGGRLPRDAEWLRAALGDVEKRYPWGDPDALCLRAAYGLSEGPCANGAKSPDTAGARPWGATPLGVLDLAGNVAEWVDDDAPSAMGVVRGGSFLESDASALRARWRRVIDGKTRAAWIGFRCAYDP